MVVAFYPPADAPPWQKTDACAVQPARGRTHATGGRPVPRLAHGARLPDQTPASPCPPRPRPRAPARHARTLRSGTGVATELCSACALLCAAVLCLCTALPAPAQGGLQGLANLLGFVIYSKTLERFIPMADTIHKVGEGMYVLMCVLFFYLHVWCALRPLTLGYTATLPRGSPLRRIAGGSTSSARPGGGGVFSRCLPPPRCYCSRASPGPAEISRQPWRKSSHGAPSLTHRGV